MSAETQRRGNRPADSPPIGQRPLVNQRGQSEPLAALVAVSLVCLVVSSCVVLLSKTAATSGTERSVAEPTADAVWQAISDTGQFDAETAIKSEVTPETLPEGYNVAITVSYIDENGKRTKAGEQAFDSSGKPTSLSAPDEAEQVRRAVTVRVSLGDKRPGRLTVEVWE